MKVAVVGAGALGSYYGARLLQHGEDVHFLLRSDYEVVRDHGVAIRSVDGDFRAHPKCARTPEEIGPCDLVLIALKTTANDQFPLLLPPLANQRTAVLCLQNGLGNLETLARLFDSSQLLGGLCFVCIHRPEPGVIDHQAFGRIVMGEYRRWPEPRTHDLCSLFRNAGVPCDIADNLHRAQWEKLVWNIPFNGLGVAGVAGFDAAAKGDSNARPIRDLCLPTNELLASEQWTALIRELMREIISVARALRLDLNDGLAECMIENTRSMADYRASTLIDFERNLPLELDSVFLEPQRRARETHVQTPRLNALCQTLTCLQKSRDRAL